MSMLQEFREFAVKGNMVDMAVGVVIGGAFGKIVSSLVADVFMPPLGLVIGGVDFTNLNVTLKQAVDKAPAVTLNYGKFVQTSFDFLIIAWAMFMVVKVINALKKEPPPAAAPSNTEVLLAEIRDLLRRQS
ncbi:MAG: large-conductance mechanosensitive channel protein MscL [Deltaproteobacteria bacterium]|nr:large-conductance mechanosensitive channel protein MscL [Deltaproteobacteria bacterium]MBI3389433.1 large-conductance mechanosensitive channel protein MscL [Deltaproteobacteria bacterium]